eukprot:CAMPEP_0171340758 /NCGR_PEP_ID=MMETSP0878-20121228/8775_1 /TAXON_ID=67004 /ORGANISM="Thalassiosira weissflogii, Strain CCMP1336" /LENGTH=314 /DNA_ID=CAMNT_0011842877 /DNA_START=78 /DNA_END=1022 /DNA_ORIENTATION=+
MKDASIISVLLAATAFANGVNSIDDGLTSLTSKSDEVSSLAASRDMFSAGSVFDIACTADMSNPNQPTVIDEATCKSQVDSNSKPCVWCDLTDITGSGLCVSPDQKDAVGNFWDQLCGSGGIAPPAPAPTPPVVTPSPTNAPTPLPTVPPTAPSDDWSGAFDCSVDGSSNIITDEATCVANPDKSSKTDQNCIWCEVPIVGGSCITNSMHETVGFLCQNEHHGNLRAAGNGDINGWNQFDPSCLADSGANNGFGGDKESCSSKADKEGNACVWCDGAGVFGVCVSPLERDALSNYLDCADFAGSVEVTDVIATE